MFAILDHPTLPLVVALSVIVIAGVWEAFTYKVPNALTLTACAAGIAFAIAKSMSMTETAGGLASAILGLIVGGATLLPLKQELGLGSGCIKAQAAFGVWVGCGVGVAGTLILLTISSIAGKCVLFLYARTLRHQTSTAHGQFPITVGVTMAVAVVLMVQ